MKRLLPFLAAILLFACIPVDDFGLFWDKAVVDPALAGDWKRIAITPGEDLTKTPGAKEMHFVLNKDEYLLSIPGKDEDKQQPMPARTLQDGEYAFLILCCDPEKHNGFLFDRYTITDGKLQFFTQNNDRVLEWLQQNYPHAKNIGHNPAGRQDGNYVVIHSFDDEVFKILGQIPDNANFWQLESQYRKK